MREGVVAALAFVLAVSGCAAVDDGRIELTQTGAADAYRSSMCRVLATDDALPSALERDDLELVLETALARAERLSNRAIVLSEQHEWPDGAEAVWRVDEALAVELEWVLAVADAPSLESARALARPDPDGRVRADAEVRSALGLPADDAELCAR